MSTRADATGAGSAAAVEGFMVVCTWRNLAAEARAAASRGLAELVPQCKSILGASRPRRNRSVSVVLAGVVEPGGERHIPVVGLFVAEPDTLSRAREPRNSLDFGSWFASLALGLLFLWELLGYLQQGCRDDPAAFFAPKGWKRSRVTNYFLDGKGSDRIERTRNSKVVQRVEGLRVHHPPVR